MYLGLTLNLKLSISQLLRFQACPADVVCFHKHATWVLCFFSEDILRSQAGFEASFGQTKKQLLESFKNSVCFCKMVLFYGSIEFLRAGWEVEEHSRTS